MSRNDMWYCKRKCELFVKCSLSHSQKWVHWSWCLKTASQQLKEHCGIVKQYHISGKPQFHFFWVCGYNKLNKFNEGNLVFADAGAWLWTGFHAEWKMVIELGSTWEWLLWKRVTIPRWQMILIGVVPKYTIFAWGMSTTIIRFIPNCHLGIVTSQIGHPVEQYWLSSVEIHSVTCSVNKRWRYCNLELIGVWFLFVFVCFIHTMFTLIRVWQSLRQPLRLRASRQDGGAPTCYPSSPVIGVWFSILKIVVTFSGMKASYIPVCCHKLWCFTTPFIHKTWLRKRNRKGIQSGLLKRGTENWKGTDDGLHVQ